MAHNSVPSELVTNVAFLSGKRIVLLLVLFLTMGVLAAEQPSAGVGEEDYKAIQGAIEDLPIDPESGEVDFDKYKPFVTKAEERIAEINLWLKTNASWLKVVFGMVPSLTWLFAIALYIWLFLLVLLVFNANATFGWISFFDKDDMNIGSFNISWVRVFGLFVFVFVIALKFSVMFANLLFDVFYVFWNYVLPIGFAIAIILAIVFWSAIVAAVPFVLRLMAWIKLKMDAKKKEKAAAKEALNREALGKIVEGAVGEN